MTGFVDKIRSMSRDRHAQKAEHASHGHSHLNPEYADSERSESRGRQYVASGRGGAGNMSHSRGRAPNPNSLDETREDLALARSKSRSRSRAPDVRASGRGGAGNIRSDSQDAASRERVAQMNKEDHDVVKKWEHEHKDDMLSGGRGGFGNVNKVTLSDAMGDAKEERITED
ncbi:hypothetical protein MNV49_001649 [Pseudohyphozyma bogoriensis]|nr:hypothetical protein MNV49_001649 [Pseudohyphozyma bogoriensis]